MGGSTHSSMDKALLSKEGAVSSSCEEESGWTEYFEEFMASEKRDAAIACSSCADNNGEASIVSDAASCVLAWKAATASRVEGLKKRRTWGRLDDDSLEDTASSPVSSPKVSDFTRLDVNPMKKDCIRNNSQDKEVASGNHSKTRGDGMNEMVIVERANECIELKERGLCLVPLSMLVDYPG